MIKSTEFEKLFQEVIDSKGEKALPNVKKIDDPAEALKRISRASGNMVVPYQMRIQEFDPPINGGQTHSIGWYPKVFRDTAGMGSQFCGSGVIVTSGEAFSFQMCDHAWNEFGANHSRGWHPKRCTKCGFDASIDSGD